MFFKKNESIKFTDKVMRKSRIPILIYDRQWKELFSNSMNKTMENLSKEIDRLVTEEKELQKKLQDKQYRKRILMNKIIHSSDRLNTKGVEGAAEDIIKSKEEISDLNEEIDKIREELEVYPREIQNTNMELLKETARIAYSEISTTESRLETIEKEIELLRERLGKYWDEKEMLEKRAQILYSLLHSIIGPEEIEKLDIKFFQK